MPILVRPVREQLEHDRVIRLLQAKYKRKFDVGMNPGAEQAAPVGVGNSAVYPDLVLQSAERSKKLLGVVEVETGESVNNLEAMSQWVAFGRLRAPFHLYVPSNMIDVARRLCQDLQIAVAEVWTYHPVGDQMRFTLVQRNATGAAEKPSRVETLRPARVEPAHAAHPAPTPEVARPEPARAVRSENGRRPTRPAAAARRQPAATTARRPSTKLRASASTTLRASSATSVRTGKPTPKARAAKAAPVRGRATAAKKKVAPARSARTQKRK